LRFFCTFIYLLPNLLVQECLLKSPGDTNTFDLHDKLTIAIISNDQ